MAKLWNLATNFSQTVEVALTECRNLYALQSSTGEAVTHVMFHPGD
jgi:hypothetical protein